MVLLAHVVAAADIEPPPVGPRGRPVRVLAAGARGLALFATDWQPDEAPLGAQDLLAHHALVEAVWRQAGCVPLRFPTWLADDPAALAVLLAREPALAEALGTTGRRAELAITVLGGSPPPPASEAAETPTTTAGAAYLRQRARNWHAAEQRRHAAEDLAADLERAVGALARAWQHRPAPPTEVWLSSALLLDRADVAAARQRIGAWSATLGAGRRALAQGPWPPYSFITLDTRATPAA